MIAFRNFDHILFMRRIIYSLESLFDFFLLFVRVNRNQRQRIYKLISLGVIDLVDAPRFDRR